MVLSPAGESTESGWELARAVSSHLTLVLTVWEELGKTLQPGNNFIGRYISETNWKTVSSLSFGLFSTVAFRRAMWKAQTGSAF